MKHLTLKKIIPYFIFLFVSAVLNFATSNFIQLKYPDRPMVPDLLFDLTPPILWTQYLSDPLIIFTGIVFFLFMYKKFTTRYLQHFFYSFGLIHLFRALIIPLTPLGRYFTNNQPYGIFQATQHGMFTSGHTAAAFLFYLLVPAKYNKLKLITLLFFFGQVIVLLLSRGHYSIDIIGGIMVAYIAHDISIHKFETKKKETWLNEI